MSIKLKISIQKNTKKNYFIYIDEEFNDNWIKLIQNKKYSKHFLLTDQNIYKLYKDFIVDLEHKLNINPKIIVLKTGEKNKHLKNTYEVYEALIKQGIDRKSVILSLGGGVVGDFAGFIASTILRGVSLIQIPTTLLAMVDSSIGGKVAVNLNIGKNMVGTFYQPDIVFCNINFLKTLPEKEWICGLAEIFKHSLLDKKTYLSLKKVILEESHYKEWNTKTWQKIIYESIKVKANIVSKDEKESHLRAVLNLGHTVAHAIESLTNYQKFSHGEAVSRGLVTALILSKKKLNFSESLFKEIINLMMLLKLPLNTAGFSEKNIWKHIQYDKKNQYDKIRYIYLKDIGKPVYNFELSREEFELGWKEQKQLFG